MPREYPAWDMDDNTRRQLGEGLDGALYSGVPGGADVEAVVQQVGRERLLEAMSGTTDKSSREWKNARDRLSRYRRGARHPDKANQAAMRGAAEARRRDQVRDRGHARVRFNATFITSKKPWEGYAVGDLTGPDLDDFLAAQAAGNSELAAQIVSEAYGLDPEFVLGIEGPSGFEIQW
jgi:hypothetical protein